MKRTYTEGLIIHLFTLALIVGAVYWFVLQYAPAGTF
jgi:hypothetical protein